MQYKLNRRTQGHVGSAPIEFERIAIAGCGSSRFSLEVRKTYPHEHRSAGGRSPIGARGEATSSEFQLMTYPHWWNGEPRNEARYEPSLVYEARQRLVDQYEARTGLVRRDREIRGSYSSQLRASYMPSAPRRSTRLVIGSNTRLASGLSRFFMVDVWPHCTQCMDGMQRLHMALDGCCAVNRVCNECVFSVF